MKKYSEMSKEELLAEKESLTKKYEEKKALGLKLDMSRGKPAPAQLELSMDMLDVINSSSDMKTEGGTDLRNYGVLDGIPEAKALMAQLMGTDVKNVMVLGNASLPIMYDTIARAMLKGICGSTPWSKLDKVKFICPVPGYDRHFAITQSFDIEMVTVPWLPDGPDMEKIEELVKDPAVKGIWVVPKYSNPTGYTCSDACVKRFAALKPAAEDFRIFWDNAYAVHDLYEDKSDSLLDIISECEKAGNPDLVFEFASTSKVTFAGAGIGAMAASSKNLEWAKKSMTIQTIGYDKINQMRHVRYLKDMDGVKTQMMKQAAIMRPKFEVVIDCLEKELADLDIACWTKPLGGYFISFQAMKGCAKRIGELCKEAGMVVTTVGATYPYGVDPDDSNVRIAPTFPTLEDMQKASELFALCVRLASVEKLLG